MRNASLSLCMVIDGDEPLLERQLSMLAEQFDDIVLVNIGPGEGVASVANRYGARHYGHRWIGSLAEARNQSLRRATTDWILWLDSDDSVEPNELVRVQEVLADLPGDAFGVSVPIERRGHKAMWGPIREIRIVRNLDQIEFEFPLDEQILPSIRRQGGSVTRAEITIQCESDAPPRYAMRSRRALRVLEDLHRQGNYQEPEVLYAAGAAHFLLGTYAHAECYLWAGATHSSPIGPFHIRATILLSECYRRLGDLDRALQICATALEQAPNDLDLSIQATNVRMAIEQGGTWQPPR